MRKKNIANPFLAQLPVSELRQFFDENIKDFQVCYINRIGSSREVSYWEVKHRNKGLSKMTFYDDRVTPPNAEIEQAWKNFMYEKFGEAYKEEYME